jgi:hypothetical protein
MSSVDDDEQLHCLPGVQADDLEHVDGDGEVGGVCRRCCRVGGICRRCCRVGAVNYFNANSCLHTSLCPCVKKSS